MATSRRRAGRIGRAGWLFADLSIILMILFAATTVKSADGDCTGKDPTPDECGPASTTTTSTTTTTTTTTTTSTPDGGAAGGFRPNPIKITVRNVDSMSAGSLRAVIERAVKKENLPDTHFGVIIIYGGSRGIDSSRGDQFADKVQTMLTGVSTESAWPRVKPTTYFETGHDNHLSYGDITLKLFPLIRD